MEKNMNKIVVFILGIGIGLSVRSIISDEKVTVTSLKVDRKAAHAIDPLFLNRVSSYALSGDVVEKEALNRLFEAARWAPSSFNDQPWFFIYGIKGTAAWDLLFDTLVDFNKSWVKNAGALVLIVSRNHFAHNNEFSRTHSFDTGAAWQNMALQATIDGLVAHGMGGFDYDKARATFAIPQGYTVEAMVAIGKPGSIENAPEAVRGRDAKPSDRKPIEDFAFEGKFEQI